MRRHSFLKYSLFLIFFQSWQLSTNCQQWIHQGSSPSKKGQVEGIIDKEVAGAINCIAPHPSNANILYVGAVNGGIWKSVNALSQGPLWQFISTDLPSQCIGALEFDRTDPSFETLVAGIGRFSSFGDRITDHYGVFRTTNGNGPWTNLDQNGVFNNHNITGICALGSVIVVATEEDGLWRTNNLGLTWSNISADQSSGLIPGKAWDLVQDPITPNTLYANAGSSGIFKSTNQGLHWEKLKNPVLDAAMASAINLKLACGREDNLFIAVIGPAGQLNHVLMSGDGGKSWKALDLPETTEAGRKCGIHPGEQGNLHISIVADPSNKNVVYVGGDRQVSPNEIDERWPPWPNSLGAMDYTGRLFRINSSLRHGEQFSSITHNGTSGNSSPHADSRDMDFDAAGNLIEGDDGGVYKRTFPSGSSGDWFSLNANLSVVEMHSVDWDANMNVIISGAQDIGTPLQELNDQIKWLNISTGDGGEVAVDDISSKTVSIRYSSFQHLNNFRKTEWGPGNHFLSETYPALINLATGDPITGFGFVAPIKINSGDGSRLLVASENGLYESYDQGNTVARIGKFVVNGDGKHVITYGAADNSDIIYVASRRLLYVRKTRNAGFTLSANYTGQVINGVTMDPDNYQTAFVIDENQVYQTTNAGSTWTRVTGNLPSSNPGRLQSIAYIPTTTNDILVVGTDIGVFTSTAPLFNSWSTFGSGLPRVPVFDLEFDLIDRILVAGTMGMGAWIFRIN